MTQKLMEATIRDWVLSNPARGERNLARLAPSTDRWDALSPEKVADALILLAGRRYIAATRVW
jgi:hypothetical protein